MASIAAANYVEPDFQVIVDKPMSSLQEHFADWVVTKTGLTFQTKKEEAAFREGLRIGTALRGVHQTSPENQERLAAARARAAEILAAKEAAPAPVKAVKTAAPAKAAPAKATKAAPAKATKAAKATKTAPAKTPPAEVEPPAKRAPAKKTGGRRPAAQTTAPDPDEAPF